MTYKIYPHPPNYFVTLSKLKESRFFSYHPPTFSDNVTLYDVFFWTASLGKLTLGILPIRIETARYVKPILPENERLCYCNSGQIGSECHVLFSCSTYNDMRHVWLNKLCIPENFRQLSEQEKLKIVLNKPENVKQTSQY